MGLQLTFAPIPHFGHRSGVEDRSPYHRHDRRRSQARPRSGVTTGRAMVASVGRPRHMRPGCAGRVLHGACFILLSAGQLARNEHLGLNEAITLLQNDPHSAWRVATAGPLGLRFGRRL